MTTNFELDGLLNDDGRYIFHVGNDVADLLTLTINYGLDEGATKGDGRVNINLGGADKLVDGTKDGANNEFFDEHGRMLTIKQTQMRCW